MALFNGSHKSMRDISAKHNRLDKMRLSKLVLEGDAKREDQQGRKDGTEVGLLK